MRRERTAHRPWPREADADHYRDPTRAVLCCAVEKINPQLSVTDLTGYTKDELCFRGIAGVRDALGVPPLLGKVDIPAAGDSPLPAGR